MTTLLSPLPLPAFAAFTQNSEASGSMVGYFDLLCLSGLVISILDSIRYEREVFECRRVGLVKKETALKVREAVYLGTLRIAQTEHEVVLASEVNQENLWGLVDHATQAAVGPEVTNVIRKLAPGVQKLITAAAKPA